MTIPLSAYFGTYASFTGIGGIILVSQTPILAPLLLFIIPTSGLLGYIAIKPPNIFKGYKALKKWKYQIKKNDY